MRDHTIELKLNKIKAELIQSLGGQTMQLMHSVVRLQLLFDVLLADVLMSRRRVIWLMILMLISPRSARAYLLDLYEDRVTRLAKEEKCFTSSREQTETPKGASKKETSSGS